MKYYQFRRFWNELCLTCNNHDFVRSVFLQCGLIFIWLFLFNLSCQSAFKVKISPHLRKDFCNRNLISHQHFKVAFQVIPALRKSISMICAPLASAVTSIQMSLNFSVTNMKCRTYLFVFVFSSTCTIFSFLVTIFTISIFGCFAKSSSLLCEREFRTFAARYENYEEWLSSINLSCPFHFSYPQWKSPQLVSFKWTEHNALKCIIRRRGLQWAKHII